MQTRKAKNTLYACDYSCVLTQSLWTWNPCTMKLQQGTNFPVYSI